MTVIRLLTLLAFVSALPGQSRAMTLEDVMRFRSIHAPKISDDGKVVVCEVRPDRGDGALHIHVVGGRRLVVPRGTAAQISSDGKFVIATVVPPFLAAGEAKHKNKLSITDVTTGKTALIDDVERAELSKDGRWIAWRHFAEKGKGKSQKKGQEAEQDSAGGGALLLARLSAPTKGSARLANRVGQFAFSPSCNWLAFVDHASGSHKGDTLVVHGLTVRASKTLKGHHLGRLAWSEKDRLACAWSETKGGVATIHIRDHAPEAVEVTPEPHEITSEHLSKGYVIPHDTDLSWSKDGKQLRFSAREKRMEDLVAASKHHKEDLDAAKKRLAKNPYDTEAILESRELDVWHYRDPLINPNQKKGWSRASKRGYRCVYDLAAGKAVQLADANMNSIQLVKRSTVALGSSNRAYRREITWDGRYRDFFFVDTKTGRRRAIVRKLQGSVSLSPTGQHAVWFRRGHWWIRAAKTNKVTCLTRRLKVPFANEDHDYPSATPGYGSAGWTEDGKSILVYDKFDVWSFAADGGERTCLTAGQGRKLGVQLRVVDLDPESDFVAPGTLLLTGLDEESKGSSIWTCDPRKPGVGKILASDDRIRIVGKAKKADRILYTREDYDRFPDLHVCGLSFDNSQRVTKLDAQRQPFLWGTAELIDWRNTDGRRIQGAVIKPGNYDPKKRYPVLVYYYRFFSQRVNEWNQMAVNHRPNFPYWSSNGYVVFLPDIRFDVGRPGPSATKCLIPGVQKLIDLGIADPKAIALHGHSWSGYQTAFVITQSNLFACAIAGAPVSNMTSAYGGVRWRTGMSRQFQYEKTQSRIGGSLWEYPERYIENSPVFFADRIQTPLLIEFGDADGAVPWYQGIELYMAMRRLNKPCVFLQYRNEPHHLKKYANKLDYTIKFKEYVDHYCRGTRAPKWIRTGLPYAGR